MVDSRRLCGPAVRRHFGSCRFRSCSGSRGRAGNYRPGACRNAASGECGRGFGGPPLARRIRLWRRGAEPVTSILHNRDLTLYLRLLRRARPFWRPLTGFLLLSLLAGPLALLRPLPLKIAVDSAIASHPLPAPLRAILPGGAAPSHWHTLLLAAGLLVAITVVTQLQSLAVTLLRAWTGERILLDFRAELFRHMQRLSLLFHDTKGSAETLYRMQHDATATQSIAIDSAVPLITSALTLAGMLYVTVRMAWQMALVAGVVSVVLFVAGKRYRRGLRKGWCEVKVLE